MKKLLVLVVLAIAMIGGLFLFKSHSPQIMNPDSVYILAVLESQVLVKKENQSEFVEVTKNIQVKTGDEIKTSVNGRASLLYPNGDITNIDHDSYLKIKTLEEGGDKSILTLFVGSVLAKVRNAVGTSDYYQVETQNSVASVRGTIFGVQFKEGKSLVLVLENKVTVSVLNPESKEILKDEVVEVESGRKVEINSAHLPDEKSPLQTRFLTKEDLSQEFVEKNLDQEDLKKQQLREIFEKVKEPLPSVRPSLKFKDFTPKEEPKATVERKEEDNLEITKEPEPRETVEKTPTPSPSSGPTVTSSSSATPSRTPIPNPTLTVTPSQIPTVSPLLSATPTPAPSPSTTPVSTALLSITPKTVDVSEEKQEIIINGKKLIGIKQVLVGESRVSFFVLDESTIFATIPSGFKSGTYDVSMVTSAGETLRLENILTVK